MRLPRLLIAAPGSSAGKTTVSILLLALARAKGLAPRAFKVGPDFIDTQYLGAAGGSLAYNLDPWFLERRALRAHFQARASSGFNLAEGAMGLFDGKRGAPFGRYSAAQVARDLDLPVLLVLNARKAGPTLATQALGLVKAGPKLRYAGVVLNMASSEKSVRLVAPALRKLTGLPVLGWLPALPALALPERHLGLIARSEALAWETGLAKALPVAAQSLGFERVLKASRSARPWQAVPPPRPLRPRARFRLALAHDEAFHFYYQENLELWQSLGAELCPFSPLRDRSLPAGAQGLYLGGGFPESFGPALERNRALKGQVRAAIAKGLPVWAECGGLMWLSRSLAELQGGRHAMVGALPAVVQMTKGLKDFGYTQASPLGSLWSERGLGPIKGHEFHHSQCQAQGRLRPGLSLAQAGRAPRREGWRLPGGLATYFHAYLPSNPRWARAFARACSAWSPA